jgi:hypothetical protein
MKTNAMKVVAVAMTAGALAAYAVSVRAEDTRGEIRALKAKLRMLEEKLDQQEKQVRGIVKFPKMPPTADVPIVCKDAPCPPLPPPVFVSFTNGLKVESWDGAFSFRIGGRILVDGGVSSQPIQSFAGFPTGNPFRPFFPSHSATGYANQLGIRQARLQVEGTAFSDWDYKFQYDFVAPSNGLVVGGIRDAYLAWRYFAPWVTFQVGNFYEPGTRGESERNQSQQRRLPIRSAAWHKIQHSRRPAVRLYPRPQLVPGQRNPLHGELGQCVPIFGALRPARSQRDPSEPFRAARPS